MKKLLLLVPLILLSLISSGQAVTDSNIKNNTNTLIRSASTVTRANHALINDELTDSKVSHLEANITSGTNTYTVSVPWANAYVTNMEVTLFVGNANTGASTLNINGYGAKSVLLQSGSALSGNELKGFVKVMYNGTTFQVMGGSGGSVSTGNLTTTTPGVSFTGNTGAVVGSGTTINIQNATTSQTGLLTNTDWNAFNGKQAAGSYSVTTNNLSDLSNAGTARTNLGLGTASTISSTAGGDLSGTLPNPTVSKLLGVSLPGLSTGYLQYTGSAFAWNSSSLTPISSWPSSTLTTDLLSSTSMLNGFDGDDGTATLTLTDASTTTWDWKSKPRGEVKWASNVAATARTLTITNHIPAAVGRIKLQKLNSADLTITLTHGGASPANFYSASDNTDYGFGPGNITTHGIVLSGAANTFYELIFSYDKGFSGMFIEVIQDNRYLKASNNLSDVTASAARTNLGVPAGSGNSTGTNTGDQTITLTGDATGSGTGSFAVSVAKLLGNTIPSNASGVLTNNGSGTLTWAAAGGGTTTNALTVDNSSLQLNSGTTFDGSAARTISVKALGITNSMLAGNIDLTSKVTGPLPIANGANFFATRGTTTISNPTTNWPRISGGKVIFKNGGASDVSLGAGIEVMDSTHNSNGAVFDFYAPLAVNGDRIFEDHSYVNGSTGLKTQMTAIYSGLVDNTLGNETANLQMNLTVKGTKSGAFFFAIDDGVAGKVKLSLPGFEGHENTKNVYLGDPTAASGAFRIANTSTGSNVKGWITNLASSGNSFEEFDVSSTTADLRLTNYHSTFTTTNSTFANGQQIEGNGAGGLSIAASDAAGVIRLYSGGKNTSNLKATLNTVGLSYNSAYVAKTANYTLTLTDRIVECTSGSFTITLPTAVGNTINYIIYNTGSGTITLATTSSQTVDLAAPGSLGAGNVTPTKIKVTSNGANWLTW